MLAPNLIEVKGHLDADKLISLLIHLFSSGCHHILKNNTVRTKKAFEIRV